MNLDLGDTRLIIDKCKEHSLLRNQAAYVLASTYWESANTMKPVKETVMPYHKDKFPSDKEVIRRLDNAYKKGLLGSVKTPYWRAGWFGRGGVQQTHEDNYRKAQERYGYPVHDNPDLMLDSEISADITVRAMKDGMYTGKKLSDYITLQKSDFYNARRIINGLDKANEIAKIARDYDKALEAEGYGTEELVTASIAALPEAKVHKPLVVSKEMIGGATGLIVAVNSFMEQIDGKLVAIALACLALGFIANRLWARYKDER